MVAIWDSRPLPLKEARAGRAHDPPPQFGEFTHVGVNHRPNQEGPKVLVRNTFIDVDDGPPKPENLERASTTPGGYPAAGQAAVVGADSPQGAMDEAVSGQRCGHSQMESPAGDGTPSPVPPPPEAMCRYSTRDEYENCESWSWAQSAGIPQAAVPGAVPSPTSRGGTSAPAQYGGQQLPVYTVQPVIPPTMGAAENAGPSGVFFHPALGGRPIRWSDGRPQEYQLEPEPQQQRQLQHLQQQQQRQQQLPFAAQVRQPFDSIQVEEPMPRGAAAPGHDVVTVAPPTPGHLDDGSGPAGDDASLASPPQPQTLTRHVSVSTGYFRVFWTVDARKLRGNDKQAVSPPFELSFGENYPNITFKMMIYPKVISDAKGGAAFKKSHGRGFVQLKCEAELSEAIANVSFRISIGSGDKAQPPRGPVSHNFSSSAVCGLPKDMDEWDFRSVVDEASSTFVVCLEIVPNRR